MAKQKELKYILGKVAAGLPADICFYDDVDDWSVERFLWEFDWLVENCPSKIRVHINSCGGSCVEGMSVFTKILDCQIPTECINDGLAASMGSVIWAAGNEVYMKVRQADRHDPQPGDVSQHHPAIAVPAQDHLQEAFRF